MTISNLNTLWQNEYQKDRVKMITVLPSEVVEFIEKTRVVGIEKMKEERILDMDVLEYDSYHVHLKWTRDGKDEFYKLTSFYNTTNDCLLRGDEVTTRGTLNKYGEITSFQSLEGYISTKTVNELSHDQTKVVYDFYCKMREHFMDYADEKEKQEENKKTVQEKKAYTGMKIIDVEEDYVGRAYVLEDGTRLYRN